MNSHSNAFVLGFVAMLSIDAQGATHGASVDFASQIAPILQEHCLRCHSPSNNKGDVSLATAANLQELDYVVPGDPDGSHLIELISSDGDEVPEMPKEAEPLSDEQVSLLRRWITDGAPWPADVVVREKAKADASWWSLQPLDVAERTATIDDFVREKLDQHGLALNPPADRPALIRRATYDLTGLPPTPQQVELFENDSDPRAYEKLIDGLLASPHYGQRWGRHWLDVVRFGESVGYERNVLIDNLWPFRDYVIRSFNDDKPMDGLISEHIAGDVIGRGDPEQAIGSAFLVAGPYDDVNNQDEAQKAQIRANTIDEMIRATSEAFLGLTVGCSRCHDHKFDPITQQDYYGLYATFAGVRHGAVPLTSPEDAAKRRQKIGPLNARLKILKQELQNLDTEILNRGQQRIADHQKRWVRPPVDRTGTVEEFDPVIAKFVRLVCEANDIDPASKLFRIDEFDVWSAEPNARNVALVSAGAVATGPARVIEDFPDAYGAQLTNDGKTGARFISTSPLLTIELAEPTRINRVVFSSARGELNPEHQKFSFVADYRIEVSDDGTDWKTVATGDDRKPVDTKPDGKNKSISSNKHRDYRLLALETTPAEAKRKAKLVVSIAKLQRDINQVPDAPLVWIGKRVAEDAAGPFHVFLGGSPQRPGDEVVPASLGVMDEVVPAYQLVADSVESERRRELARWIVRPDNPLTQRVLANRLWQYHFGTGIVDTPSDFGYMGGRPTHPQLLDFLAMKLKENGWRLKEMHRMIMMSQAYRQSSQYNDESANVDADARYLWRFPPRRLSAEEVRDTILQVAGQLDTTMGGPGFRLYHFMQDNVCTYVPLDEHGPETYRRAVYHQNARASVVDLMTEFDQPDCTFSAPKRAATTTPLQALTMLNHQFSLEMSAALAERLRRESRDDQDAQILHAYQLCYARQPTVDEIATCAELVKTHGLTALCRVLLNTSELIYVR